jgi:topoisomerase IA-like protein
MYTYMCRLVAHHPETGKEIRAGIGRYGQYIVCDGVFKSLPAAEGQCSLVHITSTCCTVHSVPI